MFTKCEPCRCFTQVTFQTLSMDIKLPIKIFLTFCIIAGCAAADNVTTDKSTTSSNPLASSCRLANRNVQKPLRARIFYRSNYDYDSMNGCIDAESLKDSMSEHGLKTSKPLRQRYLIHLAQKVNKGSVMQVRLDVYATRRYSQPLDIFLVLHSVSPFMWTLNMAHLASSVSSNRSSTLRIILTHNESKLALEQLQLPGWHIAVKHEVPKAKSFTNVSNWVEDELLKGQPLTLSVHFPVSRSGVGSKIPLNVLDLTVLPTGGAVKKPSRKKCGKTANLSNWVVGFTDAGLDDGFTSCHTNNVWTSPGNSSDNKRKNSKLRRRSKMKLLQTLEFRRGFSKIDGSGKLEVQLHVQMAPAENHDIAILALISGIPRVNFLMDLRGLKSRLIIHANFNDTIHIIPPVNQVVIVREPVGLSAEQYLARILKRYDPDGFDRDSWHMERVRFSRLPHSPSPVASKTFIDISLSARPLMLCNLESLVHLQCFNTQDLAISLNAKTFHNIGLKREWVLLGKDRCEFSESQDGRWVRKFLMQSNGPHETCGTHKSSKGEVVILSNTIYITSPHEASTGLASYPLAVQCLYATHSTDDLPPINQNPTKHGQVPVDKTLWSTWDGKKYVGPPPVNRRETSRLKLELFRDKHMKDRLRYQFLSVKSGQTLYARLEPEDQTVDYGLMVRDCFLSNTQKEDHSLGFPRQYLLIKGCNMGDGFRWKEADSYRVKIFSFVTPRLNFFSMGGYIYLHCNVQSCNYGNPKEGLPKCWNQLCLCDISEAPATTHLVSVALRNADDSDEAGVGEQNTDPIVRPQNSRPSETMVPLWGAVIIAVFAFLFGILFTFIMWCVHNRSSGHCDVSAVGDRMRHRRRLDNRRSNAGDARCFGNKDVNSRQGKPMLERAPHYRPLCLHRLLDEGHNVGTDDAPDEVVAKLLATHHAVTFDNGAGGQGYQSSDAKEDVDGLFNTAGSPGNSSRVKNSHSISCTVCGEGSSSGIGTGNCSSCSAQTCSLVDENEQPRQLPPDLAPSASSPATPTAYLSYQQQQQQQPPQQQLPLSSHFASA